MPQLLSAALHDFMQENNLIAPLADGNIQVTNLLTRPGKSVSSW